jgi:hypothetical protein
MHSTDEPQKMRRCHENLLKEYGTLLSKEGKAMLYAEDLIQTCGRTPCTLTVNATGGSL